METILGPQYGSILPLIVSALSLLGISWVRPMKTTAIPDGDDGKDRPHKRQALPRKTGLWPPPTAQVSRRRTTPRQRHRSG